MDPRKKPRAAPATYGRAHLRPDAIASSLQAAGFLTVAELSRILGVSEMTVRRDVAALAAEGRARLSHGGVHAIRGRLGDDPLDARRQRNWTPKDLIGRTAAAMIGPEDSIAIDAGSTAARVEAHLPADFAGSIVTPSVPVLAAATEHGKGRVIALGGDVFRDSAATVGPIAADNAARLRVRWFFLGAAAIDARGIYGIADIERPTKRALMAIADQVVLLADHSKFDHSAPFLICPLDEVDALVTDAPPPRAVATALAKAGVRVVLATNPG